MEFSSQMHSQYIISDNIFSPLGETTSTNFEAIKNGSTAVKRQEDLSKSDVPFYAALIENLIEDTGYTKFEQLIIQSVSNALTGSDVDVQSEKTLMIISSTKGNISLLENNKIDEALKERISFSTSSKKIQNHFGLKHQPLVVSQACISGLVALISARRLMQNGRFENIIVTGADTISRFILSGFQSFHAVSDALCKPFDANRNGINLGEAAATVVLSVHAPKTQDPIIRITGGGISNDANHISGPSRTGAELAHAMDIAIRESGVAKSAIDFISAHGTATVYNDDMESKAITINGLNKVPLNSLKGYYGHTLGAASILETVISLQSLRQNILIPTKGFETPGTEEPVNVCNELRHTALNIFLKTASGFGGCNAAIVVEKSP